MKNVKMERGYSNMSKPADMQLVNGEAKNNAPEAASL